LLASTLIQHLFRVKHRLQSEFQRKKPLNVVKKFPPTMWLGEIFCYSGSPL
jgi:hypothetical protein